VSDERLGGIQQQRIAEVDLDNCAREPIHVPGRIQPHGVLLAVSRPGLVVEHASRNSRALLGMDASELIGKRLGEIPAFADPASLERRLLSPEPEGHNPIPISLDVGGARLGCDLIAHRVRQATVPEGSLLLLELEPSAAQAQGASDPSFSSVYRRITASIACIERAGDIASLCAAVAEEARALSGFDRVMVYQFDPDWNGKVVAESKVPELEPFLGLQYPASDIPAQARALYRTNWIRLIPDVGYAPVDIEPALRPSQQGGAPGAPLDLSFSVLRSVSPMHLQYLKNMGVAASMSVSILRDGELWGLIAFHHRKPRYLPFELRQGLEFVGKFMSLRLVASEKLENREYRERLAGLQPLFREALKAESRFLDGLHRRGPGLLSLAHGATGAAIAYRGSITIVGEAPSEKDLKELVDWLRRRSQQKAVFATDRLPQIFAPASRYKQVASGMLAITIPEPEAGYVMWFKPEVIQTVNWSGNPRKPVEPGAAGAVLGPRRSFELWQETVSDRALPWAREELEAVETLRRTLIEEDLERQVTSALRSNEELDQFASIVSHDLKEPLRGISALAEFARKDAGPSLAPEAAGHLAEISQLSESARRLITALFEYSRLGKVELSFQETPVSQVLDEVLARMRPFLAENGAEVTVARQLPSVFCDRVRIGEVFANLISNAVKYNASDHKQIEVGFEQGDHGPPRFFVSDNGIGVSNEDKERIFKIFERLHGPGDYGGGTGTGLAIVRRIIERHAGRIWAESTPGEGTVFYFTLSPQS
jgi:chemotaxis family two-component system sensor kinase Cph1